MERNTHKTCFLYEWLKRKPNDWWDLPWPAGCCWAQWRRDIDGLGYLARYRWRTLAHNLTHLGGMRYTQLFEFKWSMCNSFILFKAVTKKNIVRLQLIMGKKWLAIVAKKKHLGYFNSISWKKSGKKGIAICKIKALARRIEWLRYWQQSIWLTNKSVRLTQKGDYATKEEMKRKPEKPLLIINTSKSHGFILLIWWKHVSRQKQPTSSAISENTLGKSTVR